MKKWKDGKFLKRYKLYLDGSRVGILTYSMLLRSYFFWVKYGLFNDEVQLCAKTLQEAKNESEKLLEDAMRESLRGYEAVASFYKERLEALDVSEVPKEGCV